MPSIIWLYTSIVKATLEWPNKLLAERLCERQPDIKRGCDRYGDIILQREGGAIVLRREDVDEIFGEDLDEKVWRWLIEFLAFPGTWRSLSYPGRCYF